MDERMTEMNDRNTKLEQGRDNPTSQSASMAQSHADIIGKTNSSKNVIQPPTPAERLEKLEYNSSAEEVKVKETHLLF